MTTEQRQSGGALDPGAYIGHEPEREAESIPGGVRPGDERIAAYGSQPGVTGESDSPDRPVTSERADAEEEDSSGAMAGDTSDVVTGPVDFASLRDPVEAEPLAADLDALPDYTDKAMQEPFSETWGDQSADAGLGVDDRTGEPAGADQVMAPGEQPTPDDPGADPGDIPALGGPLLV